MEAPQTPPPDEDPIARERRRGRDKGIAGFGRRFVTPIYIGTTLNPVNSSVIATALVAIAAAMGVSVGETAILVSVLYLTSAIAQPTAGRLAEEFGPRRVFLAGVVIVLIGSVIGGLAPDLTTLIVARVLIGLGTSAGYPSAMLLIRRRATDVGLTSPPRHVLAGLSITGAATIAIGPTLGGLLIGWFSWRAAFFVNIPFALVTLVMGAIWIAKDPDRLSGRSFRDIAARIDVVGVIGFGCSMTALLTFLMSLPRPNWVLLAIAVAGTVALISWELRAGRPFLDVRLLVSNRPLTRTYIRSALTLLGTYVTLYGITQWMQVVHDLSPFHAGLVLIPMGALTAISAGFVSRCRDDRKPLLLAAVLMLVGAVAMQFLADTSPIILIVVVTAIFGLMTGASNVANQSALYRQAPASALGTASGLLRTFGHVGSVASATITGIAFRVDVDDVGLHQISYILTGVGVVVLLMTAFDRRLSSLR
ncbi:MFS family permease [Rhodococcus sp. 27YEA15]|uniref:MFS transporter n=1 Tax=Rhodococcus sp. 27YEA15 TaxID=3156259 RepID=UPI003C7C71EE